MELITPDADLIIWTLYAMVGFISLIDLLINKMEARVKIAWLLVILLIPILGVIAYFILRKKFNRKQLTGS